MGNKQQVQKEIRRLVDLYRPNSPWAKMNSANNKAIAEAYDLTESALRDIVQEYHQEAQKTKDVKTYELARDIYKEYLDNFPDAEHAYRLRFYYAEILYALDAYKKAAEQYSLVVDKNRKGEFSEKAAYNAVLALQRLVEAESKGQTIKEKEGGKVDEKKAKEGIKQNVKLSDMKLVAGKAYEKKEIPEIEKLLAIACDRFTEFYPKNNEFFAVKFKTAHIYYKYNHFDEASKRFGEFIDRYPENKYSQYAADLILDSYNIKEDWKNVHYWAKRFTEVKKLAGQPDENNKKQQFVVHLNEVVEGSRFKIAMDIMDKERKKEEAAVAFRSFVNDFPESKHNLKALYNAMVLFSDVLQLDKAIETGGLILAKFAKETPGAAKGSAKVQKISVAKKEPKKAPKPDKKGAGKKDDKAAEAAEDKSAKAEEIDPIERTIFLLATYYDKVSDFKTAADFYERYFDKYPKTKDAPDSLYNAALFRESLGDHNRAIENYGKYVKEYPTNKDNPDIQFKIGKIYAKREDWPKAKAIFQGFLDKYGKQVTVPRNIEAEYELAMTLRKMDQRAAAEKELEKLVKMSTGLKKEDASEKVFFMIAHSRFLLVEPLYREYEGIKLELPQAKMKVSLKAKGEKLAKLVEAYTDILKMGQGDMGVACLCRIGLIYQNFAKALFEAPIPKELNEEQREIYTAELQNMAFPVEEKAIEAFEKALQKAYELGVYNEWTTLAQENLNKYKPGTYPDLPPTSYVAKEYFFQPGTLVSAAEPKPAPKPAPKPEPKPDAKPDGDAKKDKGPGEGAEGADKPEKTETDAADPAEGQ
jgi:TolA-binding protein